MALKKYLWSSVALLTLFTSQVSAAETVDYNKRLDPVALTDNVYWLDLGNKDLWRGSEPITVQNNQIRLMKGMTFEQEVSPGLTVKLVVKNVRPFSSTEIFRDRILEKKPEDIYLYKPERTYLNIYQDHTNNKWGQTLLASPIDLNWAEAVGAGLFNRSKYPQIKTTKRPTVLTTRNFMGTGVELEISAMYRGEPIDPTIIGLDGESANVRETTIFTTNGSPWNLVGELMIQKDSYHYIPTDFNKVITAAQVGKTDYLTENGIKVNMEDVVRLWAQDPNFGKPEKWSPTNDTIYYATSWPYFQNPDLKTGGIGSQVFGPVMNTRDFRTDKPLTTPVISTTSVSEIGVYIASSGIQSALFGLSVTDRGDAPASYGIAEHVLSPNNTDGPYLGSTKPDLNLKDTKANWMGDDESLEADEGVEQLTGKKDSEVLQVKDVATMPVKINTTKTAYVRGWVDFNENGKFDEDEASEIVTVNSTGTIELRFTNHHSVNPNKQYGIRVRTSSVEDQIKNPTGLAMDGEVEDLQLKINQKAPVIANYYLQGTDTKLADSDDQGLLPVNSDYKTIVKEIPDKVESVERDGKIYTTTTKYTLVEVPSNQNGTVPVEGTVVNYYYNVTVTDSESEIPKFTKHLIEGTETEILPQEDGFTNYNEHVIRYEGKRYKYNEHTEETDRLRKHYYIPIEANELPATGTFGLVGAISTAGAAVLSALGLAKVKNREMTD